MDIDIIRDQKLGAGAGLRSNKVCFRFLSVLKSDAYIYLDY